jgi:hypothetical protein
MKEKENPVKLAYVATLLALTSALAGAANNGTSTNRIDDAAVRGIADAMARNGMRDAGYVYVNIDDTWECERDARGNIEPNHKFSNIKALADYVHSKGLKLGVYSSPGPQHL